ncbi:MAG: aminoacyl-tRNA hydrolase [Gemmatimonadales bacterium]
MGLGNPGPQYEDTRHNAGFLLADRLVRRWELGRFRRRGPARVAEGKRREVSLRVIKPETYMNRSGAALVPLADDPHFDPDQDLLVLVDDVALDLGRFRLRATGSAGGHNGLRSVEEVLGSQQYARLRIGVGPRPFGSEDLADYVLDRFTSTEREILDATLDPMAEAVECWLDQGIEVAMNRSNRKPSTP